MTQQATEQAAHIHIMSCHSPCPLQVFATNKFEKEMAATFGGGNAGDEVRAFRHLDQFRPHVVEPCTWVRCLNPAFAAHIPRQARVTWSAPFRPPWCQAPYSTSSFP